MNTSSNPPQFQPVMPRAGKFTHAPWRPCGPVSVTRSVAIPREPMPSAKSQAATSPSLGAASPAESESSSATPSARLQTLGLSILPFRWFPTQSEPGALARPASVNAVPASLGPPATARSTTASPESRTIGETRLFVELTTLFEYSVTVCSPSKPAATEYQHHG